MQRLVFDNYTKFIDADRLINSTRPTLQSLKDDIKLFRQDAADYTNFISNVHRTALEVQPELVKMIEATQWTKRSEECQQLPVKLNTLLNATQFIKLIEALGDKLQFIDDARQTDKSLQYVYLQCRDTIFRMGSIVEKNLRNISNCDKDCLAESISVLFNFQNFGIKFDPNEDDGRDFVTSEYDPEDKLIESVMYNFEQIFKNFQPKDSYQFMNFLMNTLFPNLSIVCQRIDCDYSDFLISDNYPKIKNYFVKDQNQIFLDKMFQMIKEYIEMTFEDQILRQFRNFSFQSLENFEEYLRNLKTIADYLLSFDSLKNLKIDLFTPFNDLLFELCTKLFDSNLSKFIEQFNGMIVKIYKDFTLSNSENCEVNILNVSTESTIQVMDMFQILLLKPIASLSRNFSMPAPSQNHRETNSTLLTHLLSPFTKLISLVSRKHQELFENLIRHLNLFLAALMYQNMTEIAFLPYLFILVNNFFKNSAIYFTEMMNIEFSSIIGFSGAQNSQHSPEALQIKLPDFYVPLKSFNYKLQLSFLHSASKFLHSIIHIAVERSATKVHSEPPSSVRSAFIELCKALRDFQATYNSLFNVTTNPHGLGGSVNSICNLEKNQYQTLQQQESNNSIFKSLAPLPVIQQNAIKRYGLIFVDQSETFTALIRQLVLCIESQLIGLSIGSHFAIHQLQIDFRFLEGQVDNIFHKENLRIGYLKFEDLSVILRQKLLTGGFKMLDEANLQKSMQNI
ncbi:MAG: Vacuolar protein sorting-associated protein 51, variant 2 [Marteilia pararefringens]